MSRINLPKVEPVPLGIAAAIGGLVTLYLWYVLVNWYELP